MYPARSARAVGTRRSCDLAQPRRAAISTCQIEPPRRCAHFGTSHAPRKSLEAALGNAWSSLLAQGKLLARAQPELNLTCRSILDLPVGSLVAFWSTTVLLSTPHHDNFLVASFRMNEGRSSAYISSVHLEVQLCTSKCTDPAPAAARVRAREGPAGWRPGHCQGSNQSDPLHAKCFADSRRCPLAPR